MADIVYQVGDTVIAAQPEGFLVAFRSGTKESQPNLEIENGKQLVVGEQDVGDEWLKLAFDGFGLGWVKKRNVQPSPAFLARRQAEKAHSVEQVVKCKAFACRKPSWNGAPTEYCSTRCRADHLCRKDGCNKPTWNDMPKEFCGTICRNESKQVRVCKNRNCGNFATRRFEYCSKACKQLCAQAAASTNCKRGGCGKPSWNEKADEYCSSACKDLHGQQRRKADEDNFRAIFRAIEEEFKDTGDRRRKATVRLLDSATRSAVGVVAAPSFCMSPHCGKPTWNQLPYGWCSTLCKEAVLGPVGGQFSRDLAELMEWLQTSTEIQDDVIGDVLLICKREKLTKQLLARATDEDLRGLFPFGVAMHLIDQRSSQRKLSHEDSHLDCGPLKLLQSLGPAGFGENWKALYQGKFHSVRRAECSENLNFANTLLRESLCLVKIEHPLIVRVWDAFVLLEKEGMVVNTVMDFCDRGDLSKRIEERKMLSTPILEDEACKILASVACALEFMHFRGMAHKDLKPNNVLFCSDPADQAREVIKVADFGIANIIRNARGELRDLGKWMSHLPPEDADNLVGFLSGDVWAVGLMAAEVACLKLEHKRIDCQEQVDQLLSSPELNQYSGAYKGNLIQRALCITPQLRATTTDLLRSEPLSRVRSQLPEIPGEEHVEYFVHRTVWMAPFSKLDDRELRDIGAFPGSVKFCSFKPEECSDAARAAQESLLELIVPKNQTFARDYFVHESWFCHCPHRERTFVGKLLDLNENLKNKNAFSLEEALEGADTPDGSWRRRVLEHFDGYPSLCSRDDGIPLENVRVHIAFHATSSVEVAKLLMKGNFANLQKLDSGYFGSGIYVTLDAEYAIEEYGRGYFELDKVPLIVCAVVIGNPFPIIETFDSEHSYQGFPITAKADAHVVVVATEPVPDGEEQPAPGPIEPDRWGTLPTYTEIVLNEAQVLPLAMLLVEKRTP